MDRDAQPSENLAPPGATALIHILSHIYQSDAPQTDDALSVLSIIKQNLHQKATFLDQLRHQLASLPSSTSKALIDILTAQTIIALGCPINAPITQDNLNTFKTWYDQLAQTQSKDIANPKHIELRYSSIILCILLLIYNDHTETPSFQAIEHMLQTTPCCRQLMYTEELWVMLDTLDTKPTNKNLFTEYPLLNRLLISSKLKKALIKDKLPPEGIICTILALKEIASSQNHINPFVTYPELLTMIANEYTNNPPTIRRALIQFMDYTKDPQTNAKLVYLVYLMLSQEFKFTKKITALGIMQKEILWLVQTLKQRPIPEDLKKKLISLSIQCGHYALFLELTVDGDIRQKGYTLVPGEEILCMHIPYKLAEMTEAGDPTYAILQDLIYDTGKHNPLELLSIMQHKSSDNKSIIDKLLRCRLKCIGIQDATASEKIRSVMQNKMISIHKLIVFMLSKLGPLENIVHYLKHKIYHQYELLSVLACESHLFDNLTTKILVHHQAEGHGEKKHPAFFDAKTLYLHAYFLPQIATCFKKNQKAKHPFNKKIDQSDLWETQTEYEYTTWTLCLLDHLALKYPKDNYYKNLLPAMRARIRQFIQLRNHQKSLFDAFANYLDVNEALSSLVSPATRDFVQSLITTIQAPVVVEKQGQPTQSLAELLERLESINPPAQPQLKAPKSNKKKKKHKRKKAQVLTPKDTEIKAAAPPPIPEVHDIPPSPTEDLEAHDIPPSPTEDLEAHEVPPSPTEDLDIMSELVEAIRTQQPFEQSADTCSDSGISSAQSGDIPPEPTPPKIVTKMIHHCRVFFVRYSNSFPKLTLPKAFDENKKHTLQAVCQIMQMLEALLAHTYTKEPINLGKLPDTPSAVMKQFRTHLAKFNWRLHQTIEQLTEHLPEQQAEIAKISALLQHPLSTGYYRPLAEYYTPGQVAFLNTLQACFEMFELSLAVTGSGIQKPGSDIDCQSRPFKNISMQEIIEKVTQLLKLPEIDTVCRSKIKGLFSNQHNGITSTCYQATLTHEHLGEFDISVYQYQEIAQQLEDRRRHIFTFSALLQDIKTNCIWILPAGAVNVFATIPCFNFLNEIQDLQFFEQFDYGFIFRMLAKFMLEINTKQMRTSPSVRHFLSQLQNGQLDRAKVLAGITYLLNHFEKSSWDIAQFMLTYQLFNYLRISATQHYISARYHRFINSVLPFKCLTGKAFLALFFLDLPKHIGLQAQDTLRDIDQTLWPQKADGCFPKVVQQLHADTQLSDRLKCIPTSQARSFFDATLLAVAHHTPAQRVKRTRETLPLFGLAEERNAQDLASQTPNGHAVFS